MLLQKSTMCTKHKRSKKPYSFLVSVQPSGQATRWARHEHASLNSHCVHFVHSAGMHDLAGNRTALGLLLDLYTLPFPPSPQSQASSLSTPAPASRGCKQSHPGLSGQTDQPLFGRKLRPVRSHEPCKPTRRHVMSRQTKAYRRSCTTTSHCAMPSSACTGKHFDREPRRIAITGSWQIVAHSFVVQPNENTASRNRVRVAVLAWQYLDRTRPLRTP